MQWSVRFEISRPDLVFTEDHADEIMDALESHSASVSYSTHTMSARFCVDADLPMRAAASGLQLLRSALKKAGIKAPPASIAEFEVQAFDDLDRSLGEANVPDLVGVAETAEILKVSRQRVSQLMRVRNFPRPFVILASGPVWKKSTITRHVGHWDRRPGRRRRLVPA